ncbi:MAG TPA: hypothetical protein VFY73_18715 [Ideonella sp.]|uniref:hypothetical protein n=1 Tax=Ideonella sp. TaxID=1929293 RepID=UPI002E2FB5F1|nr:hypothetical protein [Ideonella sp.]HEX5686063.1 hypothetical protein [Ideonella sp.]
MANRTVIAAGATGLVGREILQGLLADPSVAAVHSLVSATGADAGSEVFYSRVKGELQDALAKLPFEGLVIARPSMFEPPRSPA